MNPGVFSVVGSIRFAKNLGCIRTKDILKCLEPLDAQFVTVAYEKGALKLPSVCQTLFRLSG